MLVRTGCIFIALHLRSPLTKCSAWAFTRCVLCSVNVFFVKFKNLPIKPDNRTVSRVLTPGYDDRYCDHFKRKRWVIAFFSCYEFYKKRLIIAFSFRRISIMHTISFLLILICWDFIIELILKLFFLRCIFPDVYFKQDLFTSPMLIFIQFHCIIKWIFTFFAIKSSWMGNV